MPLFGSQEKVFDKILSPGKVNMKIATDKVEFQFLGYLSWATNSELEFFEKI